MTTNWFNGWCCGDFVDGMWIKSGGSGSSDWDGDHLLQRCDNVRRWACSWLIWRGARETKKKKANNKREGMWEEGQEVWENEEEEEEVWRCTLVTWSDQRTIKQLNWYERTQCWFVFWRKRNECTNEKKLKRNKQNNETWKIITSVVRIPLWD